MFISTVHFWKIQQNNSQKPQRVEKQQLWHNDNRIPTMEEIGLSVSKHHSVPWESCLKAARDLVWVTHGHPDFYKLFFSK